VRELEHLAGHGALDAVHARDAVADRHDAAHFGDVDLHGVAADLVADDLGNLFGSDIHLLASRLDLRLSTFGSRPERLGLEAKPKAESLLHVFRELGAHLRQLRRHAAS
jgi:hypothetical protein